MLRSGVSLKDIIVSNNPKRSIANARCQKLREQLVHHPRVSAHLAAAKKAGIIPAGIHAQKDSVKEAIFDQAQKKRQRRAWIVIDSQIRAAPTDAPEQLVFLFRRRMEPSETGGICIALLLNCNQFFVTLEQFG